LDKAIGYKGSTMRLEAQIQIDITAWLKKNGYFVIRLMSVKPAGMPDLVVIKKDSTHIYLEVKNEIGRLSSMQEYMHTKLKSRNCEVYVVRSLDEVKEIFDETD
jgi:hypothetical protein